MSGTIHSENVLKDIFGLTNFKIVEAETRAPGVITKYRTGLEKNCKYSNLHAGENSRENYLRALNSCLEKAKLPVLVHISSFGDLPSNTEKEKFGLKNLMSREELTEMQKKSGNVRMFKEGKIKSLFTTKCSRGVDFPGEECNSIVLTKYPYPNLQGIFWKILKKEQPEKFVELYLDKAKRDLVQKIARGIRFIGDHIFLLSPDSRVLDAKLD
jgi:Rad3-related DNA helicase